MASFRSPTLIYQKANNIALFETHEHAFEIKPLESTVPQQPKPAPVAEQKMKDDTLAFKPKSKDQQKLNCQKEANQSANGKDIDEKEDFLHQIRTKSFTLRRTATAKPTISSGPTASNKVSAILEKANAIRQAVASDDGEDDDWSDT
uniref:WH2 domain-containing protein n=1 Tax=Salix viminalis TaxID=40686 RepID=A0A6N2KEJ7_SALVM